MNEDMLKRLICSLSFIVALCGARAENSVIEDYNRSSLFTFSILNPGYGMTNEIYRTLLKIETPDRFNDHNLSLRVLSTEGDPTEEELQGQITAFLERNKVGQRLVSKWFNRDRNDGSFDMELIKERGNYNATVEDVNAALQTVRGRAMLEDAGEQLIGNTFVIVNHISYFDKKKVGDAIESVFTVLKLAAQVAGAASGSGSMGTITMSGEGISSLVAGFRVKVKSYLYKLEWNDSIAGIFYSQCYFDKGNSDMAKRRAYAKNAGIFRLSYVGDYEATSSKTVLRGLKRDEEVFLKVLTRALDENIVQLRKKFEIFKITAPVFETAANDEVHIHIGLKEGVSPESRYEVLERIEDGEGRISYKRRGTLKPVVGKIWDNRCMAVEEEADGAGLGYTTFEVASGGDFYPGMLVRELGK